MGASFLCMMGASRDDATSKRGFMWTGIWSLFFAFMVWFTPATTPVPVTQTPIVIPKPTPKLAPRPIATPMPAPRPTPYQSLPNHLYGPNGLNTSVTYYSDCSGHTPLTTTSAAIDTCTPAGIYFVGHNVGVFTPLMSYSVGTTLIYDDGQNVAHHLKVISIRDNVPGKYAAFSAQVQLNEFGQLQTCETGYPDGSLDRIIDVVEI